MSRRIHFTVAALKALETPARGRQYWYDDECPGLELCITAKGTRSFCLKRRIGTEVVRFRIGRWPGITIDTARKAAEQLRGRLALGDDPRAQRKEAQKGVTLEDAFAAYMNRHLTPYRRRPDLATEIFESAFAHWKRRKLTSITEANVQELHRRLARMAYLRARRRAQNRARKAAGSDPGEQAKAARRAALAVPKTYGQARANRALRLLRAVINKARRWGLHSGANPAAGLAVFHEVKRRRFLQPEELKPFFEAVAAEPNVDGRDYIMLALLTGARKSNLLAAQWSDMRVAKDVKDPTWIIPAADAKAGEPIIVPLVPDAAAILRRRLEANPTATFVFPSEDSESGHLQDPRWVWLKVLARAGLKDLRMHDLRRSLGSWQARQGASLTVIGKSLGHSSLAATQIYAQLGVDPVRQSMEAAVGAMMVAGEQRQPAEVIPLKAAGRRVKR